MSGRGPVVDGENRHLGDVNEDLKANIPVDVAIQSDLTVAPCAGYRVMSAIESNTNCFIRLVSTTDTAIVPD